MTNRPVALICANTLKPFGAVRYTGADLRGLVRDAIVHEEMSLKLPLLSGAKFVASD